MKVRIRLAALTRMEYEEVVEVPDDTPQFKLDALVNDTYDKIEGDEYTEDHEYWEKGHCSWEEVKPTKLELLEEATNKAIALAAQDKKQFNESINWGDLRCVNVEQISQSLREENVDYRVFIEELAPDCIHFRDFILSELDSAGYDNIEVVMEW